MTGMEVALASGMLKVAGNKLVLLIASDFAAITGVKKDLLELQDIHGEITSWLSTVRDLSIENDPQFRWIIKLKDIAYDIDDLLCKVHLEAEKHDNDAYEPAVAGCFSAKPKSFLFRCKLAHKIKAIKERLAEIAKQRSDMNAIGHNLTVNQPVLSRNRAAGAWSLLTNVEESQISTRDQEKDEIILTLLQPSDREDGWIVSVVGLGGSGKTTLAKHICHDNKIKEHFQDKIFWVHVSQKFDVKKLIGKLFEAITKQKSDLYAPQLMVDEISKELAGDKFLLVMDDAWHQDKDDWKEFMVHLKSHAPGSKIMLTTRDQKVAEAMKSRHIFELTFLPEAESWSLFLKSSGWAEEELGSEFIQVGKEILRKCGGVPLAIKALGGILSEKREISTWRAIRESDLWNEENTEVRVFGSLKLSYIHLKDHLKQCFTFFSIFPKGYRIKKTYLIEQWIAHGFIKLMKEEKPEVIGSEYFDSFVKAGFLQGSLEAWHGDAYKMHDLIHDLTRYILQSEVVTSLPKDTTKDCTRKCRYLSLISCSEKEEVFFDKVRALYVSKGNPSLEKLAKKSRYICSVVLHYEIETPFPMFILKLDYLGYLEIRNASCRKLPEAISGCRNLQSLHFIDCYGFATLPVSIGKLKKLRTLELTWANLKSLPESIGDCRDLQSLQIQSCHRFREMPKTIGKIENLRVLRIVECANLQQLPSEFIGDFRNIQTINLADCWRFKDLPITFSSRTLRILNLSETGVTKLPEWVTLIGTLECMNLEECGNLVELPRGIGNLKRLEVLNLSGCWNMNWMPSGFAQMTRLKRLDMFAVGRGGHDARISDLEKLDMISGDMEIKNLEHLMDSSDAEKACLNKKKNILKLTLSWASVTKQEFVSDLSVLDALEPPSRVEKLHIYGYRGSHLPCWMCKQRDSSYLEGAMFFLKQTSTPRLFCLILLELSGMPNLKHMQGILVLPSLKTLLLNDMPSLEELWTATTGLEIGEEEVSEQSCFPVLSELVIRGCPKLIVEPHFPPSLEKLTLTRCSEKLILPGSYFFRPLPPCVRIRILGSSS